MLKIPFHRPYIGEDEISEVVDSLKSGWLTMGPKTVTFEEQFNRFIGAGHSVAVSSCTAALHLSLKAIGLKPGDEVIVPTMTFTATAEVVCYFGARPVVVDVAKDTHTISLSAIEAAITPKTRALIPVHFGGQPCDMDEIIGIAKKHNLSVVEDAAHSLPARYKGRMIGTIGDMTCFSFYATKTLATGEGGMITTGNDAWSERVKIMRLHGISKDAWKRYSDEGSWYYEVVEAGYKYNMTDLQAALGIAQLKKVESMQVRREGIAARYTNAFTPREELMTPAVKPDRRTAWHLYVIKLNLEALTISRSRFIEELNARGVGTSVHFIPLHRHPFYKDTFHYRAEDFPAAEWVYERSVSLPIYPGMTDAEIDYVVGVIIDVLKRYRR